MAESDFFVDTKGNHFDFNKYGKIYKNDDFINKFGQDEANNELVECVRLLNELIAKVSNIDLSKLDNLPAVVDQLQVIAERLNTITTPTSITRDEATEESQRPHVKFQQNPIRPLIESNGMDGILSEEEINELLEGIDKTEQELKETANVGRATTEELSDGLREVNEQIEAEVNGLDTLEEKLEYLREIKKESKFLETAEERKMDMEEKAWDVGGNNPKSEADSQRKIQQYQELSDHIDKANDALDEFNNKYEKILITLKNGQQIEIFDASDLDNLTLAKNRIQDIQFVLEKVDEEESKPNEKPITGDIDAEIKAFYDLSDAIEEVKKAIHRKDELLGEEASLVRQLLPEEIEWFDKLNNKIDDIIQTIASKITMIRLERAEVEAAIQAEIAALDQLINNPPIDIKLTIDDQKLVQDIKDALSKVDFDIGLAPGVAPGGGSGKGKGKGQGNQNQGQGGSTPPKGGKRPKAPQGVFDETEVWRRDKKGNYARSYEYKNKTTSITQGANGDILIRRDKTSNAATEEDKKQKELQQKKNALYKEEQKLLIANLSLQNEITKAEINDSNKLGEIRKGNEELIRQNKERLAEISEERKANTALHDQKLANERDKAVTKATYKYDQERQGLLESKQIKAAEEEARIRNKIEQDAETERARIAKEQQAKAAKQRQELIQQQKQEEAELAKQEQNRLKKTTELYKHLRDMIQQIKDLKELGRDKEAEEVAKQLSKSREQLKIFKGGMYYDATEDEKIGRAYDVATARAAKKESQSETASNKDEYNKIVKILNAYNQVRKLQIQGVELTDEQRKAIDDYHALNIQTVKDEELKTQLLQKEAKILEDINATTLKTVKNFASKDMLRLLELQGSNSRTDGEQAELESLLARFKQIQQLDFGESIKPSIESQQLLDNYRDISGYTGAIRDDLIAQLGELKVQDKYTQSFRNEWAAIEDEIKSIDFSGLNIEDAAKKYAELLEKIQDISQRRGTADTLLASNEEINKRMADINKTLYDSSSMSGKLRKQFKDLRAEYAKLLDSDAPKAQLDQLNTQFAKLKNELHEAGYYGKSFFTQFKEAVRNRSMQTLATYFSFQDIIRYGREFVNTIKELDTSLVDLRKTTSMSTKELNEFYIESNNIAKQMGVTTNEIIQQAAAWSRLNKIGLLYGNI